MAFTGFTPTSYNASNGVIIGYTNGPMGTSTPVYGPKPSATTQTQPVASQVYNPGSASGATSNGVIANSGTGASVSTSDGKTTINPPTAPTLNLTPTYASTILGGVPTTQTAYSGGTNAISPMQAGFQNASAAGMNATNANNSGTVGNQQVGAATSNLDLSNQQLASELLAGLNPQFNSQDRALTEQMANAGIVGGSTTGAQNALNANQQSQFTAALAPLLLQQEQTALSQSQGNQSAENATNQFNSTQNLNAQDTNVANQNAINLANQSAQNQAAQYNAGNQQAINLANQQAYNQNQQYNAGNNLTAQTTNAANILNNNQYNTTAANQMAQYNTGNAINMANDNATIYNNQVNNAANFANQDYLAQLQTATDLQTQNANAPSSNFIAQQYTPAQVNLGNLGNLAYTPTTANSTAATATQTPVAA